MKIALRLLTFLMFLSLAIPTFGQRGICGTSHQDQLEGLDRLTHNRNLQGTLAKARGAVTYVPVQVHIVTDGDGESFPPYGDVIEMMCVLNEEFAVVDMQFYFVGPFNIFATDRAHPFYLNSTFARSALRTRKVNNAVNIFIIGDILANQQDDPNSGPTVQAFYTPGSTNDFITIDKAFLTEESVLAHEMGHLFTLAHPFFGWEGSDSNGNPNNWTDTEYGGKAVGEFAPNGTTRNELADSSNCTIAADRICDTPPDYLFAYVSGQQCQDFDGDALDPDGMPVDPMEVNMMSYFSSCRDYVFTEDQKVAMQNDLANNSSRAYIRSSYIPNLTEITDPVTIISPEEGERSDYNNYFEFVWNSVPNATSYTIEISEVVSFLTKSHQFVTEDTSFVFTTDDFRSNRPVFWRITAYHEFGFCNDRSAINTFRTGSGTLSADEIEGVSEWSVLPNPLKQGQELNLFIDVDRSFEADIQLHSLDGRLLQSVNGQRFQAGENRMRLTVDGLHAGLYLLSVRSEDGVLNKRVVIME